MEFSYEVNKKDSDTLEVSLKGYLDEFSTLPENFDFSKLKTVIFNFSGVEFINSGGIKLWINYVDSLESQPDLNVHLSHCRRIIVDQINLIEGFLPKNGQVDSVYVPVFCNSCGNSMDVFQEVKKLHEKMLDILDQIKKPCCDEVAKSKKHLELDVVPTHFLRFLKSNP